MQTVLRQLFDCNFLLYICNIGLDYPRTLEIFTVQIPLEIIIICPSLFIKYCQLTGHLDIVMSLTLTDQRKDLHLNILYLYTVSVLFCFIYRGCLLNFFLQ